MKKFDFHIEFSHIYADEEFGEEQISGILKLKEVIENLKAEGKTFITSILIDDFNPVQLKLDEDIFLSKVRSYGVPIDFVAYESKFCPVANKIIKTLPNSNLIFEYFNSSNKEILVLNSNGKKIGLRERRSMKQKHTCAILSSAWTLCRLGCYNFPKGSLKKLSNKSYQAKEILTILPKKYMKSEDKVIEIIQSAKFSKLLTKVHYVFLAE
jgi:hypothetical protein